jgi:hypothetical protein
VDKNSPQNVLTIAPGTTSHLRKEAYVIGAPFSIALVVLRKKYYSDLRSTGLIGLRFGESGLILG